MKPRRTIVWDIYEEHLDEAAFLRGAWEAALTGADYTLAEVVDGPEERLRAHLDGLVWGGADVAERLLAPALADEDPGKVFAAAWSLLHAEDADHFAAVLAASPAVPPPSREGLARAIELGERRDLPQKLAARWDGATPFLRSVILDTLALRDPVWARARLPEVMSSSEIELSLAALRVLQSAPDDQFTQDLERLARHSDPSVREEAIAAAYVIDRRVALDACRREAERGGEVWLALALLALSSHGSMAPSSFEKWLANPGMRRQGTWALGFAGNLEAGDRLVELLADEELAPLAAEALAAMTGVPVAGPLSRPRATMGSGSPPVEPDDPPPRVLPEDHLPMPNLDAVKKLWHAARTKLRPGAAYLQGRPRAQDSLRQALLESTMWRRPAIALEIAATERTPVPVHRRAWGRAQRASSGAPMGARVGLPV